MAVRERRRGQLVIFEHEGQNRLPGNFDNVFLYGVQHGAKLRHDMFGGASDSEGVS